MESYNKTSSQGFIIIISHSFPNSLIIFHSSPVTSELAFLKGIYDSVTDREKMHIDAVLAFVDKNSPKACELWSKIVDNYPLGKSVWSNNEHGHVTGGPSHYRPPCCLVDIRRHCGNRRVRENERLYGYSDTGLSKGHAHLSLRIEHVIVVTVVSGCGYNECSSLGMLSRWKRQTQEMQLKKCVTKVYNYSARTLGAYIH